MSPTSGSSARSISSPDASTRPGSTPVRRSTWPEQQKVRGQEVHALFQLGAVHAHASPPDVQQAEARYREALMLAEALGMRPLQAHCHRGLGTLYTKTGRQEQARAALATAIELYRAMEMTFWLPQTEAALAEVEGH